MKTIFSEKHIQQNSKSELAGGQLIKPYECPERMNYILNECEKLFGQKIPKPIWYKPFYWEHGVGDWLPGYDSKQVSKHMIKPIKYKNLFICGENYSRNFQCWAEGALETAENVFKKM